MEEFGLEVFSQHFCIISIIMDRRSASAFSSIILIMRRAAKAVGNEGFWLPLRNVCIASTDVKTHKDAMYVSPDNEIPYQDMRRQQNSNIRRGSYKLAEATF